MKKRFQFNAFNLSKFIVDQPLQSASIFLVCAIFSAVLFLQLTEADELKPSYYIVEPILRSQAFSVLNNSGGASPTGVKKVPQFNKETFSSPSKSSSSSSSSAGVNSTSPQSSSSASVKLLAANEKTNISSVSKNNNSSSSLRSSSKITRILLVNPELPPGSQNGSTPSGSRNLPNIPNWGQGGVL